MRASRDLSSLSPQYANLQFFADFSQYTLQKRRALNTITKLLRNHKIVYRWGYPARLTVTHEEATHVIDSLERGISLLKQWRILLESEEGDLPGREKWDGHPEWRLVTTKNSRSHK